MEDPKRVESGAKVELKDQEHQCGGQSGSEKGAMDWPGFLPHLWRLIAHKVAHTRSKSLTFMTQAFDVK